MSKYWSQTIRDLIPYTPGEQPQDQQYIKLNTNENPYPPSPKVLQAIKDAANDTLRLYPDPQCSTLRRTIAEYYGLTKEQVFVGNGSDEVLALVFLTFFKQELPLLFPDLTYSFYQVYCQFFGIQPYIIPVHDDFTIQLADYAQLNDARPNGGIIFANPNAHDRAVCGGSGHSTIATDENRFSRGC
jgi:histidinol-phosphate aminotransferase